MVQNDNVFKTKKSLVGMERREKIYHIVTSISLLILVIVVFSLISKIPGVADEKVVGLTGNVFLELDSNLHVGDSVGGDIIIGNNKGNGYGFLLLTKDGDSIITKTFNLEEVPKKKVGDKYSVSFGDLLNYTFEEEGTYELFFSVLDLDINIKSEFVVGPE